MADKKAEAKPEAPVEGATKRKKINALTLAEIESRLAECREKQGGTLHSKYALQLLARKKALSGKA